MQDKYPKGGVDIPLRELLHLSVELSDNTATDIILRVTGGTEAVGRYVKSLGISGFHIEDNEAAMHRDETKQYRNWFQPAAAVQLLRRLVDNPPLNPERYRSGSDVDARRYSNFRTDQGVASVQARWSMHVRQVGNG